MIPRFRSTLSLLLIALMVAAPASVLASDSYYGYKPRTLVYEVTVTNVTKGQVFSPPVLVTHSRDVALFEAGQPALDELAIVAEDGAGAPLAELASSLPGVFEAQSTTAPIPPGASAVYRIESTWRFPVISVVSMLVNTNDAFLAIDSRRLPRGRHSTRSFTASAYDAGSEANNEDCRFVPGPACPADSGNLRATDDAEGFVHIHNGVHGIADLGAAAYDWRNPVARISVKRVR